MTLTIEQHLRHGRQVCQTRDVVCLPCKYSMCAHFCSHACCCRCKACCCPILDNDPAGGSMQGCGLIVVSQLTVKAGSRLVPVAIQYTNICQLSKFAALCTVKQATNIWVDQMYVGDCSFVCHNYKLLCHVVAAEWPAHLAPHLHRFMVGCIACRHCSSFIDFDVELDQTQQQCI